jgi:SAM-dependent methyltransferase
VTDRPAESAARHRDHYSYRHYADRGVAERFDELRFGGPIGRYLADAQAALLREALAPLEGRTVVDVGAGTGRAAVELARAGARVIGVDASGEMLHVALARAAGAGVAVALAVADAHDLPLADRSVDAGISLRLLMHAPDWRRCVAELCRVARWRVVVDFPAALSFAALQSGGRRALARLGRDVEAYRVMRESSVRQALAASGFRVVAVHRQFVLPIALHKRVGHLPSTRAIEGVLSAVGLRRLLASPVSVVAER